MPDRPVISNFGAVTERISEFLDRHTQPLVAEIILSVIEDTRKKLQSLGYVPSTSILCTLDIVGLYPHIPHEGGLDSLSRAIQNSKEELPVDRLIALAKIIL